MKKIISIIFAVMLLSTSVACNSSKETNANISKKVIIPAIKLPESTSTTMDMIGVVVYNGKIYTQAEYLVCDSATKKSLTDKYLGKATGMLEDTKELLSNVTGDVYSVKGYDENFRICIPEMNDGAKFIAFFENLNGIMLEKGKDLFGDRLHLKENYIEATYKLNNDWNNNNANSKKFEGLTSLDFDNFFDVLYKSPFEDISNKVDIMDLKGFNSDFKQSHIFFKMKDKTTIELRLFENGYVGYQGMLGMVFAKMENDDTFLKIFQASQR